MRLFLKYLKEMIKLYKDCDNVELQNKVLRLNIPSILSEVRANRGTQKTFIYCKECRLELMSTSWIAHFEEDEHSYCCNNCGETMTYKFGIAPVPIEVENHLY